MLPHLKIHLSHLLRNKQVTFTAGYDYDFCCFQYYICYFRYGFKAHFLDINGTTNDDGQSRLSEEAVERLVIRKEAFEDLERWEI